MEDGHVKRTAVPMRNAMNEVLRDWDVDDCLSGVDALEQNAQTVRDW